MNDKLYLKSGSWTVTNGAVSTPRRTFRLEHVQALTLSKPLFVESLILAGLLGLNLIAFDDVLSANEMLVTGGLAFVGVLGASQLGKLTITAASPRGDVRDDMIGWWPRLRSVRAAIDQALDDRIQS